MHLVEHKLDYKKIRTWVVGVLICYCGALLTNHIYCFFLGDTTVEALSADRIVIFAIVFLFGYIHFVFDVQDIYSFLYRHRFKIAFLLFLVCICFKVHFSSIAEWRNYFAADSSPYQYPILGKSRPIRSDEWLVYTPLAMSQKYTGYASVNEIARAWPTNMLTTYNQPVWDITAVAKPFYLGYLLFGSEVGLSWFWCGRLIALFLVTFELFLIITRHNKKYALASAFLITFAACVQWWSIGGFLTEMLIYGQLAEVMIYRFLNTSSPIKKLVCAVVFALCGLGYLFALYPAWMIPLFYLFAVLAVWIIVENYQNKPRTRREFLYPLLSLLIIAAVALAWLISSMETIALTMNTVYPGKRFSVGGGGLDTLFWYLNNLFLPYGTVGNSCSPAMAYGFFPFTEILVCLYLFKTEFKDKMLASLAALDLFFLTYLVLGVPEMVAKWTLMSYTTSSRLTPMICLIEVIMYIRLLSGTDDPLLKKKQSMVVWGALCVLAICIVMEANERIPAELNVKDGLGSIERGIVIALIAGFCSVFFVKRTAKMKTIFAVVAVFVSLVTGAAINPIMRTTDAIYEKNVADAVREIQQAAPGTWLSTNFIYSNFLIANSAPTINSTNIMPVLDRWEMIDAEGEFADIYNRYAHISVELTDGESGFALLQTDHFQLFLNYEDMKLLGVDYLCVNAGYTFPSEKFVNSLEQLYADGITEIYRVIY